MHKPTPEVVDPPLPMAKPIIALLSDFGTRDHYAGVMKGVVLSLSLRRHGESQVPQEGWHRTDEVFRDPTSGRLMRVWVDPIDGSRHYVPERG